MSENVAEGNKKVHVIGKRVLIKKEQLDLGGLQVTPSMEDGEKNRGVIVGVGQVGLFAKLRGIKVGAKVLFNRHFAPNFTGEADNLVFVDLEHILGIEQ